MASPNDLITGIIIVVFLIITLVIIAILKIRRLGQPIECPECGHEFKRPAFYNKGVVFKSYTCPKCDHKDLSSNFRRVESFDDIKDE